MHQFSHGLLREENTFFKIEDSQVRSYLTYLTQTKEQRIYNFGKRHHGHKTKRNETKMKTESSQKRSIE